MLIINELFIHCLQNSQNIITRQNHKYASDLKEEQNVEMNNMKCWYITVKGNSFSKF
jgi:hypothetical protein